MTDKRQTVIGIGNALVDILTRIDNDDILKELGLPKSSMQLVDDECSARIAAPFANKAKTLGRGGSAANTIHRLSQMRQQDGLHLLHLERRDRTVLRGVDARSRSTTHCVP